MKRPHMLPLLLAAALLCAAGCRSDGLSGGEKLHRLLFGYDRRADLRNLASDDPETRRWAVIRLGRNADPLDSTAIAALLDRNVERSPLVRAAAAAALRRLGDARILPELREAAGDPEYYVRLEAVRSIGALGGKDDIALLTAKLRNDPRAGVRLESAHSLTRIGDASAIPALIAALDDPDSSVRFAAHRALCRITGKNPAPTPTAWVESLYPAH